MKEHPDSIEVEKQASGTVRVAIAGEVDLSRFDELASVLDSAQSDGASVLEIDLSSVSFMDSQGLRLLVRTHQQAAEKGSRVLIVDPSRAVRHLFELTGLSSLLEVTAEEKQQELCPCCSRALARSDVTGDGLRPGDAWCQECRWIVMREVLSGGDWPVECPTHGRVIPQPPI